MSGTKGKRFALPNSRILIHQPSMGGLSGQAPTSISMRAKFFASGKSPTG